MVMEWMDIIRLMEENYDEINKGKFDLLLTVGCHLSDLLLTIYQGLRHK